MFGGGCGEIKNMVVFMSLFVCFLLRLIGKEKEMVE